MSSDVAEVDNVLWAGEVLKIERHSLLQFCLLLCLSSLNMKTLRQELCLHFSLLGP